MTAWLLPRANSSENQNSLDTNKNDENDQDNLSASAVGIDKNPDRNVNSNDESKNVFFAIPIFILAHSKLFIGMKKNIRRSCLL